MYSSQLVLVSASLSPQTRFWFRARRTKRAADGGVRESEGEAAMPAEYEACAGQFSHCLGCRCGKYSKPCFVLVGEGGLAAVVPAQSEPGPLFIFPSAPTQRLLAAQGI
jgi:hypothetical protein